MTEIQVTYSWITKATSFSHFFPVFTVTVILTKIKLFMKSQELCTQLPHIWVFLYSMGNVISSFIPLSNH